MIEKKLMSLDNLFGLQENETDIKFQGKKEVISIDVDTLKEYNNHTFKLYNGERLKDMVDSIKEFGVLTPLLIRVIEGTNKYEILAGHNRWNAAKIAGLKEVPAILMQVSSEEDAALIVAETNLIQRSFSDLLHSERAYVLEQQYNMLKKQGKKNKLIDEVNYLLNTDEIGELTTSRPVGEKLLIGENVGENYGLSARSVSRYLRINKLLQALKDKIDILEISVRAGVEISYLNAQSQMMLNEILESEKLKIDELKAKNLRNNKEKLNEDIIKAILKGEFKVKKKVSIPKNIKIDNAIIKKYFDQIKEDEVQNIIDKALELYFNNQNI